MNLRRTILLCALQVALISSIACKYLYERKVCPRVRVEVTGYDPENPMRGRYYSVQPIVDACSLNRADAVHTKASNNYNGSMSPESWRWPVHLIARNGTLVPLPSSFEEDETHVSYKATESCSRASTDLRIDIYVPEHAKSGFPLAWGEHAWLVATVPPAGPPRAVALTIEH